MPACLPACLPGLVWHWQGSATQNPAYELPLYITAMSLLVLLRQVNVCYEQKNDPPTHTTHATHRALQPPRDRPPASVCIHHQHHAGVRASCSDGTNIFIFLKLMDSNLVLFIALKEEITQKKMLCMYIIRK
jgi:hypothetical protein